MSLVFSKENFKKNASRSIKKTLSPYLEVLEGKPVDFTKDEKNGIIDSYWYEDEEYYLYPVLPEWCKERTK